MPAPGLALALALAASCAPAATAPARQTADLGLQPASRGLLSYAVAFAQRGEHTLLLSVELDTAFHLAIRELVAAPGGGARLVDRARVPLGPHEWDVSDLAVDRAGSTAYVASADGTVRAIDLAAARAGGTWRLGEAATAAAVSPDGALIAAGGASGILCLRRAGAGLRGPLLQCFAAHGAAIASLAFSPDGARLATASHDGRVRVLAVPSLAVLAELDAGGSANAVAFSPDGARLAIAVSGAAPALAPSRGPDTADPRARVLLWWPLRAGPAPRALAGHRGPVTAVAWLAPDRLLSAGWDRTVRLWDAGAGREIARAGGFSHIVRDVAVAPGGLWAAAAAWTPPGGDGPATALLGLAAAP